MKTVAGGDVDLHPEFGFKQQFDVDKIERIEFAVRIVVDEQIKVAFGLGLAARDRAEQLKRGRAERFDGAGVSLQFRDRFSLVHFGKCTRKSPGNHPPTSWLSIACSPSSAATHAQSFIWLRNQVT